MRRTIASVLALLLGNAAALNAQTAPTPPPLPPPSWTITLTGHSGEGGPSQSMLTHLQDVGGFRTQDLCFFASCLDYPRSFRPTPQVSLAVGRTFGGRLGVRALVGTGSLGWASGEGDSGSVSWNWSATTLSPQMTFDLHPTPSIKDVAFGATFGGGPLLAWVRSRRGVPRAYPADSNSQVTRLGFDLRATGTMWMGKHFFMGLDFGYRFLPGRTEGPYALDTGSRVLTAFDVAYSHFIWGASFGVRFWSP